MVHLNEPLWPVENMGFNAFGRSFPGFAQRDGRRHHVVEPRAVKHVDAVAGDVFSLTSDAAETTVHLLAFDQMGRDASGHLGLTVNSHLEAREAQLEQLNGWIAAHGGVPELQMKSVELPVGADQSTFRVSENCDIWIVNPVTPEGLAEGQSKPTVTLIQTSADGSAALPPPLGDVREEILVSRGTARAYELKPGQKVQIIDLEGQQCSDFQALTLRELDKGIERTISSTATRSMVRQAFPRPGLHDKFYNGEISPMLRVVQDTCGRHDTFSLACNARGYEERGFPGHLNCSDNISNALAPFGVARRKAWPAINFFWSTWVDAHHHLLTEESWSRPGDYLVLEAMQDLVCVSTACPDDIDPINGWNPTDILVRIYDQDQKISRAVGYREKEDAPMLISEESAFHVRTAPLTDHFASARDLWAPSVYASTGTLEEYWACRNAVTVQDMSGLRKFDVVGPDAEALLQRATTRDVAKLAHWRGQYALICDEAGTVIDDGTLFRMAPNIFRWCGGTEESGRALQDLARTSGLQVRINALRNALPNLAIQGPKSRDLMRRICFTQPTVPSLDHLKWFGATVARLHDREGAPFMLTRTGYTGELGYEVFCGKDDAVLIWDAIMEAGADLGVTPMGSAALEIIRIEAGLAAANAEFAPNVNAFEAGLGFAVDFKKSEFVGRDALVRASENPSKVLKGLVFENNDSPAHGAPVYLGERQVGVVTSATRSPTFECAIALARVAIEHTTDGLKLEVGQLDGRMKRLSATVAAPAFVDPKRTRARA